MKFPLVRLVFVTAVIFLADGFQVKAANTALKPFIFNTIAGSPSVQGTNDGTGASALFNKPQGVAVDTNDNLYVVDSGNNILRTIATNGAVTTLTLTNGSFYQPCGIAIDAATNLYVSDTGDNTIKKIDINGGVTTLAGSIRGSSNGIGTNALFIRPQGTVLDTNGNLFIVDSGNNAIRKIATNGLVSTLAGTNAGFFQPFGITEDASSNLYVTDSGNHRICKVTANGVVTVVAGGSTNGIFVSPQGIAVDPIGNLYVADYGNNTIRKVATNGAVTTLAGSVGVAGSTDGTGTNALFYQPSGISIDAAKNLFITDRGNNTIRKIDTNGVVSTLAGATSGSNDGIGTQALFKQPGGITVDKATNLYVMDSGNNSLRFLQQSFGSWFVATSTNVGFVQPFGIALDGATNLYVADSGNNVIRKIDINGVMTTLAGSTATNGSADGIGTNALFKQPEGIAVDGATNLYITDAGNNTIRMITPLVTTNTNVPIVTNWTVTTLAGTAGVPGTNDGTNALFKQPEGIAVDGSTNLYVADSGNNTIRMIAPLVTTNTNAPFVTNWTVTTIVRTNAGLFQPFGIALDSATNLYVADSGNNLIRGIVSSGTNRLVSTLGGSVAGHADGTGTNASFSQPLGITVDGGGNLFVTDSGNNTIRKGIPSVPPNQAQFIRFGSIPRMMFGISQPYSLNAIASSGLPVSFTSANTNVGIISNNILRLAGAGLTTITATQPGNAIYRAAPAVRQVLIVARGVQVLTMGAISTNALIYGNTNGIPLVVTNSSGLAVNFISSNTNAVTLSTNVVTLTNGVAITSNTLTIAGAGISTLTVSQAGNTNFNAVSLNKVLTVAKGTNLISFTSPTNNATQAFTTNGVIPLVALSSSGLSVSFSSTSTNISINGTNATMLGTGTAPIRASQAGNANYNAATPVTNSVIIQ